MHQFTDHDFLQLAKHTKNRREHQRLLMLAHLKEGKSIQETADALFVHHVTVRACKKHFIEQGLEGLKR